MSTAIAGILNTYAKIQLAVLRPTPARLVSCSNVFGTTELNSVIN